MKNSNHPESKRISKATAAVAAAGLSLLAISLASGCAQTPVPRAADKAADESDAIAKTAVQDRPQAKPTVGIPAKDKPGAESRPAQQQEEKVSDDSASEPDTTLVEDGDIGYGSVPQATSEESTAKQVSLEPEDEVPAPTTPAASSPAQVIPAPASVPTDEPSSSSLPEGTVLVKCGISYLSRSNEPIVVDDVETIAEMFDVQSYVVVCDAIGHRIEGASPLEMFDAAFFEDNYLVAAFADAGSGSYRAVVNSATCSEDGTWDIDIEIVRLEPGQMGTCDMAYWTALIPQPR